MQVTETLDLGAKVNGLTPRQIQCLQLVYQRRTSKEIAAELGLSAATIDTYITDAVGILGARNRRHAAEILHTAIPPREFGSRSSGDEPSTTPPQELPRKPFRWSEWLLVRQLGAFGNDVHPAIRVLFIPIGAILIAIGFGALASGARIVSDLFAVWLR